MDFTDVQHSLRLFARDRDWEQFHTPRNLMLALAGEVGELAAEMQWKAESEPEVSRRSPELSFRPTEEIADVAIYLLRLADVLEIDLGAAITAKIAMNAEKYPADEVRGSAAKYTAIGGRLMEGATSVQPGSFPVPLPRPRGSSSVPVVCDQLPGVVPVGPLPRQEVWVLRRSLRSCTGESYSTALGPSAGSLSRVAYRSG